MGGGSAGKPGEKKTNKSVNKCHPAPVRSTFLWNHDKKKQLKLLIESHSSIKKPPTREKKEENLRDNKIESSEVACVLVNY